MATALPTSGTMPHLPAGNRMAIQQQLGHPDAQASPKLESAANPSGPAPDTEDDSDG